MAAAIASHSLRIVYEELDIVAAMPAASCKAYDLLHWLGVELKKYGGGAPALCAGTTLECVRTGRTLLLDEDMSAFERVTLVPGGGLEAARARLALADTPERIMHVLVVLVGDRGARTAVMVPATPRFTIGEVAAIALRSDTRPYSLSATLSKTRVYARNADGHVCCEGPCAVLGTLIADVFGESDDVCVEVHGVAPSAAADLCTVFVKDLGGATHAFKLAPHECTTDTLMVMIYEHTRIPCDQQRLIFAGASLAPGKSLASQHVERASTIHLVLRMRGGMLLPTNGRIRFTVLPALEAAKRGADPEAPAEKRRKQSRS